MTRRRQRRRKKNPGLGTLAGSRTNPAHAGRQVYYSEGPTVSEVLEKIAKSKGTIPQNARVVRHRKHAMHKDSPRGFYAVWSKGSQEEFLFLGKSTRWAAEFLGTTKKSVQKMQEDIGRRERGFSDDDVFQIRSVPKSPFYAGPQPLDDEPPQAPKRSSRRSSGGRAALPAANKRHTGSKAEALTLLAQQKGVGRSVEYIQGQGISGWHVDGIWKAKNYKEIVRYIGTTDKKVREVMADLKGGSSRQASQPKPSKPSRSSRPSRAGRTALPPGQSSARADELTRMAQDAGIGDSVTYVQGKGVSGWYLGSKRIGKNFKDAKKAIARRAQRTRQSRGQTLPSSGTVYNMGRPQRKALPPKRASGSEVEVRLTGARVEVTVRGIQKGHKAYQKAQKAARDNFGAVRSAGTDHGKTYRRYYFDVVGK